MADNGRKLNQNFENNITAINLFKLNQILMEFRCLLINILTQIFLSNYCRCDFLSLLSSQIIRCSSYVYQLEHNYKDLLRTNNNTEIIKQFKSKQSALNQSDLNSINMNKMMNIIQMNSKQNKINSLNDRNEEDNVNDQNLSSIELNCSIELTRILFEYRIVLLYIVTKAISLNKWKQRNNVSSNKFSLQINCNCNYSFELINQIIHNLNDIYLLENKYSELVAAEKINDKFLSSCFDLKRPKFINVNKHPYPDEPSSSLQLKKQKIMSLNQQKSFLNKQNNTIADCDGKNQNCNLIKITSETIAKPLNRKLTTDDRNMIHQLRSQNFTYRNIKEYFLLHGKKIGNGSISRILNSKK